MIVLKLLNHIRHVSLFDYMQNLKTRTLPHPKKGHQFYKLKTVRVLFDGNGNEYLNFEGHNFLKHEWEISLLHMMMSKFQNPSGEFFVTYDGIKLTLIFGNYIQSTYKFWYFILLNLGD